MFLKKKITVLNLSVQVSFGVEPVILKRPIYGKKKSTCYLDFYSKQLLFNDSFPYVCCFQAGGFKLEKFYKSSHFQLNL